MDLRQHRAAILVGAIILSLFVASPAIAQFMVMPQVTSYSELGMLGPQQIAADYPSDVHPNEPYTVFLDVINHLEHVTYYMIEVKLVNEAQLSNPSIVPSLNNITFFVANEESLQQSLTFALDYDAPDNQSSPQVRHLIVNGVTCYPLDYFGAWDNDVQGYRAYLVFELWLFSDSLGCFQNHGRFVDLVLTLRG